MLPTVSDHRRMTIDAGHADRFDGDTSAPPVLIGDFADDLDHTPTAAVSGRPPGREPTAWQRHRFYRNALIHCGRLEGMSVRQVSLATGIARFGVDKILAGTPSFGVRSAARGLGGLGVKAAARDRLIRCGQRRGMSERQLSRATGLARSYVHTILARPECPC